MAMDLPAKLEQQQQQHNHQQQHQQKSQLQKLQQPKQHPKPSSTTTSSSGCPMKTTTTTTTPANGDRQQVLLIGNGNSNQHQPHAVDDDDHDDALQQTRRPPPPPPQSISNKLHQQQQDNVEHHNDDDQPPSEDDANAATDLLNEGIIKLSVATLKKGGEDDCCESAKKALAVPEATIRHLAAKEEVEEGHGEVEEAVQEEDEELDCAPLVRDETSGCVHYKRKAKFVTPCCGKFYKCRYCHDENEEHHFDRKTLTELICTRCDTRQKVQAECEACGVRFGRYTCLICNLFDDEDKDQYHCHGCGICRLGGRSNFFHCEVCNMCLPIQLRTDGHRCVENISRSNCPVCLGDIHTSRIPCHIPDCGHLLHRTCFDQLLASGHYVCPTCQTSMIDMKKLWDYLDLQALNMPVPKSYQNSSVNIFCNDCFKQSTVKFHFVGLKCGNCGGYNTSQNIQKRSWNNSKDNPSTSA